MQDKVQEMHELSIAMNIVEIVEESAADANCKAVSEIDLEIGSMSGVVIEALQFALEEAVKSSIMETARINIHEISARVKCIACAHEFEPEDIIAVCPECGHIYADVIRGKEMKVRRITFFEE